MKKIFNNIKRFILACFMVFTGVLTAYCQTSDKLQGKYLTEDYNTKSADGMIKVTYMFANDSLYIDVYPSGCGLACMSLEKTTRDYIATETIVDSEDNTRIAYIKKYHLEFLPCIWDKKCLAVYRDGSVVDIIRKL